MFGSMGFYIVIETKDAVLLENMGKTVADVRIAVSGKARVIDSLRGKFVVNPDGISLAGLPPHSYAAVRFSLTGEAQ